MQTKSIEARMRRVLSRRFEYVLQKSRRRDPYANDYNGYWIVDPSTNALVYPFGPGAESGVSLDEIVEWVEDQEEN